ncbi:hypothetical protein AD428_19795 [Achromobacter sp. DMS1]|nr:hypothetical protein AD428_19795 [Achromobacter sp. DMS1]
MRRGFPLFPIMTYCIAARLDSGLVFLSDSRTNAGVDQISVFRKMTVFELPGERVMALMTSPIENEANNGLKNDKYTVAMARTSDPHSATAQFFINVSNNDFLNFTAPTPNGWGYAVFGAVTEGTEVVDKIKGVKTGNKGFHQNVPNEDVVIEKAEVVE